MHMCEIAVRRKFQLSLLYTVVISNYNALPLISTYIVKLKRKVPVKLAARKALEDAIESPLLDKVSLGGAKGILIHFNINPQVSLLAINNVMGSINDNIDSNAEIIFGTTTDASLEPDEVKIIIVATGFESKNDMNEEENEPKNSDKDMKVNLSSDDENYLDIPPLMRDYVVQYQL